MAKRIVFGSRGRVALEQFESAPVPESSLRIRISCSLISPGTERIALQGVFDTGTHWAEAVKYPFYPGYSAVGVVAELGTGVTDFALGDQVACRAGHASEHLVPAYRCTRAQGAFDPRHATWFSLAKIALLGARSARYELGDQVAVIGTGPIGQMSARRAVAAEADVVAADVLGSRLDTARRGEASATVAGRVERNTRTDFDRFPRKTTSDSRRQNRERGGLRRRARACRGPRARCTARRHGFAEQPAPDLRRHHPQCGHRRGARRPQPYRSRWDGDRGIHETFFRLVVQGRFSLDGLDTHTFRPDQCELAYETATLNASGAMGTVFDWTTL